MCNLNFVCIPGKSWQDKVKDVLKVMEEKNTSMLLLTALDDIACKFYIVINSKTKIIIIKLIRAYEPAWL